MNLFKKKPKKYSFSLKGCENTPYSHEAKMGEIISSDMDTEDKAQCLYLNMKCHPYNLLNTSENLYEAQNIQYATVGCYIDTQLRDDDKKVEDLNDKFNVAHNNIRKLVAITPDKVTFDQSTNPETLKQEITQLRRIIRAKKAYMYARSVLTENDKTNADIPLAH